MANVKNIKIGNTNYNIVDSGARDLITTINNALTKSTQSVNGVDLTKEGNFINYHFSEVGSQNITNINIPSDYRPSKQITINGLIFNGTNYFVGYVIISPNGSSKCYFWYGDNTLIQVQDNNYKFSGDLTIIN